MSKGEIVEEGTHDGLIAKEGHYYNLVTTQAQAYKEFNNNNNDIKEEGDDEKIVYETPKEVAIQPKKEVNKFFQ